jgi:hypothetical protein
MRNTHPLVNWLTPVAQGMGYGAQIDVLQLTACRYTASQTRYAQASLFQHFGNDMRGGFSFTCEVGGQDHLLDQAIPTTLRQFGKT